MTVLAVGIGRADPTELRLAVTDGSTQNLIFAQDTNQLYGLHPDLADLLCGLARGTGVTVRYNSSVSAVINVVSSFFIMTLAWPVKPARVMIQ